MTYDHAHKKHSSRLICFVDIEGVEERINFVFSWFVFR